MKLMRSIYFISGVIIISLSSQVFAGDSSPARTLTADKIEDIYQSIEDAQDAANATDLMIDLVVWARGIQAYELTSEGWSARGPLADLYPLKIRGNGKVKLKFDKIGAHYQHLASPAWEFEDGRVIAESATPIPGASDADIAWLDVDLLPNDFGYQKILRIETRAGLAPNNTNWLPGVRTGTGYDTVYVFLK